MRIMGSASQLHFLPSRASICVHMGRGIRKYDETFRRAACNGVTEDKEQFDGSELKYRGEGGRGRKKE